jgi:hypothetical protein
MLCVLLKLSTHQIAGTELHVLIVTSVSIDLRCGIFTNSDLYSLYTAIPPYYHPLNVHESTAA